MYNIALVCTHHSEIGKSNSDELYKIIETIRPDVIFEELTQDLFDKVYKENIPIDIPEIKSVKRYLKDRPVSHFPVDIVASDILSTRETYLFDIFNQYTVYSVLEKDHREMIFQEGYSFLNSKKSEELIERKAEVAKSLIKEAQIGKEHLTQIHNEFYELQHYRENEIIKNIYNYSEKIVYNQAVLLIGSWHRKSLFEKIKSYESENSAKLKWALHGN